MRGGSGKFSFNSMVISTAVGAGGYYTQKYFQNIFSTHIYIKTWNKSF